MPTPMRLHRNVLFAVLGILLSYMPSAAPLTITQAAEACRVGTNYATIQAALDDVNCTTVEVGAGTFVEHLTIGRDVTLQGTAGQTVIDGSNNGSVIMVAAGMTATIANVVIQHGGGFNGVALHNAGTLTLRGSRIQNNIAPVSTEGDAPRIVDNQGTLVIERTAINGNTGANGIVFSSGLLTIRDSTIIENIGDGLTVTAQTTLTNVTIAKNIGTGLSTGFYNERPMIALTNVTIAENQDGAIYSRGLITATNVTIAANTSDSSYTPGIRNSGTITFTNSLIALTYQVNYPFVMCEGEYGGAFISNGHNIDTGSGCNFTQPTDQQNVTPKLIPLRDNGGPVPTVALRPTSPAVNAGGSTACPTTDARGVARPANSACDIGAYELQSGPTISALGPNTATQYSPGRTLTVTGSGFDRGATVYWDEKPLPTTFVNSTKLLAAVAKYEDIFISTQPDEEAKTRQVEVSVINGGTGGTSNVQTFTVTPADRPVYAKPLSGGGGGTATVAVNGNLAYISRGVQLDVLNVSNPAAPLLLGSYAGIEPIHDIDLVGSRAYLTLGLGGIGVLDVSNPAAIRWLGGIDTPGIAYDITVVGNLAYVADGPDGGGLRIIDVTNPTQLRELGAYKDIPAYDLQIEGSTVYVAAASRKVAVIDVSNPAKPTLIDQSYYPLGDAAAGIALTPTHVLVAAGGEDLIILNKNGLSYNRDIELPGTAKDVIISGTTAYVTSYEGLLHIVDVSDIAAPQLLATYATNGSAWDVRVQDGRAYVADGFGGLEIVDLSIATEPRLLGEYGASSVNGFVSSGKYMYTYGQGNIEAFDMTVPAAPKNTATLPNTATIVDGDTEGNLLLLAQAGTYTQGEIGYHGGGLKVIDITQPAQLTPLATYPVSTSHSVDVVGSTAYLCADDGLHILDISKPAVPALRKLVALTPGRNTPCFDVQVIDGIAYVAALVNDSVGFRIINVQNPDAPEMLSQVETNSYRSPIIRVVGTRMYILGSSILNIYDVSNPRLPVLINSYFPLGSFLPLYDIDIQGNLAYLVIGDGFNRGEVEAVDFTNPDKPVYLWSIPVLPDVRQVKVDGALMYLAAKQGGLRTFSLRNDLVECKAQIRAAGGQLTNFDGSVSLQFPAGAVTQPITVTYAGLFAPTAMLDAGKAAVKSFLLEARDAEGRPVVQFAQPYTLTISYTDEQISALGIEEEDLNIAFWDGTAWVDLLPCAGCSLDTRANRITAVVDHLTEFILYNKGQTIPQPVKRTVYLPLMQR